MPVITLDYKNTKIKDTFVTLSSPTQVLSSATSIDVGHASNGDIRRALLQFDKSLIPNNVIINSATLKLTTANGVLITLRAHKVVSDFNIDSVVWNTQPMYDDAFTTAATTGFTGSVINIDVKNIIQDLVNGDGFGILLKGDDQASISTFASQEASTATNRPILTIDYSIPTEDKKQVEVVATYSDGINNANGGMDIDLDSVFASKQNGDMIVLYLLASSYDLAIPTGWNLLAKENFFNELTSYVLYKTVDGVNDHDFMLVLNNQGLFVYNFIFVLYRNVKNIYDHGPLRIGNGSTVSPNLPTNLGENRLIVLHNLEFNNLPITQPINFTKTEKTTAYTNAVSHSYNHRKTAYTTAELTSVISTAYAMSAKVLSLEPVTNEAPRINGQDEHLGTFDTPVVKQYMVSDIEGDAVTIVEKVDGNIIRTRNAAGTFNVDLSSIWSTISIGRHTITVETNDDYSDPPHAPRIRTWTFFKILGQDTSLIESIRGVQDLVPIYTGLKRLLVDKIGGNVGDSFEDIISGAELTKQVSGTYNPIKTHDTLAITGLPFRPKIIIVEHHYGGYDRRQVYWEGESNLVNRTVYHVNTATGNLEIGTTTTPAVINDDGFSWYVPNSVGGNLISWTVIGKAGN